MRLIGLPCCCGDLCWGRWPKPQSMQVTITGIDPGGIYCPFCQNDEGQTRTLNWTGYQCGSMSDPFGTFVRYENHWGVPNSVPSNTCSGSKTTIWNWYTFTRFIHYTDPITNPPLTFFRHEWITQVGGGDEVNRGGNWTCADGELTYASGLHNKCSAASATDPGWTITLANIQDANRIIIPDTGCRISFDVRNIFGETNISAVANYLSGTSWRYTQGTSPTYTVTILTGAGNLPKVTVTRSPTGGHPTEEYEWDEAANKFVANSGVGELRLLRTLPGLPS